MKISERVIIALSFIGAAYSIGSLLSYSVVANLFDSAFFQSLLIGLLGAMTGIFSVVVLLRTWKKESSPSIFISYHQENKDIARKIATEIKTISNHVWFDELEIEIGDDIHQKIESGFKDSYYVIVVLSEGATDSAWLKHELVKAVESGKKVLPVMIDNSVPPDLIKNIAYADLSDSFELGMEKLKDSILIHSQKNA